jgi:hypothetical protein
MRHLGGIPQDIIRGPSRAPQAGGVGGANKRSREERDSSEKCDAAANRVVVVPLCFQITDAR